MNTFDEIIQTKKYTDLTSSELELVHEVISSEEEYNEMKSFYTEIGQIAISNRAEVSASVKASLNSVFQAKHPGIHQNWSAPAEVEEKKTVPLYNRKLFRVAALLVLSAGVITVWVSLSENQLDTMEKAKVTASKDSVASKEEKEPRKKFPLNEEDNKLVTAASNIPADENSNQKTTIYTNATVSYQDDAAMELNSPKPVRKTTSKVSESATITSAGPTYSFSTKEKESEKNIEDVKTLSETGMDADLNPGGFFSKSTIDYKPRISTTDLLSLIEPSF